jgi:Rrf2 family protein
MILRRDRAMLAVAIALDIAFHGGRGMVVPGAAVADRLGELRRGIEPLLQSLARAGILASTRGPRGGYRLAQPARDLTLAAIVAAVLEPAEAPAAVSALQRVAVEPAWQETEAAAMAALSRLTLADLLARAAAAGLQRPVREPLSFAI